MRATRSLANFDSATAMLRALAAFLHGRSFPALGLRSLAALRPLAPVVNRLPDTVRAQVYIWSGFSEAVPAERLRDVSAERIAAWAAGRYPARRYPAAFVGSSNGAAIHLAAALGAPWLPQTFLIPVRHPGLDPDDVPAAIAWARDPAEALLRANPELRLHHMHDPNQDRLMIRRMAYFRVKRLRLGPAYEDFLSAALAPGATIVAVDCGRTWPSTLVDDRHVFQMGALGGLEAHDYLEGSERVSAFLRREGAARRRWEAPEAEVEAPEAEWGFASELLDDLQPLCSRRGFRLRRLTFHEPEDLSPLVADLHRSWYRRHGLAADRLLVESFILLEPLLTLRERLVPFWTKFAVEREADSLERYLATAEPYDEIDAMLFSHGVESAGVAGPERWRRALERARRRSGFAGVDTASFPRDFAVFLRYERALRRLAKDGGAQPIEPLALSDVEQFLADARGRYAVQLE